MKDRSNSTRKIVPRSIGKFTMEEKDTTLLRKIRGRWILVTPDESDSRITPPMLTLSTIRDQVVIITGGPKQSVLLCLSLSDKKNCA